MISLIEKIEFSIFLRPHFLKPVWVDTLGSQQARSQKGGARVHLHPVKDYKMFEFSRVLA